MALWPSIPDTNGNVAWTLGGTNLFRNANCTYFLPSENEWYKAAYFDPNKNGGSGGYWLYPTGSDSAPTAVPSGTVMGTTVHDGVGTNPASIYQSGGLSSYGIMGCGGNVWQWQESAYAGFNTDPTGDRVRRGGDYIDNNFVELASTRGYGYYVNPTTEYNRIGFRVASIFVSNPQISSQPQDVSLTATNSQNAFSVVVTNGIPPYGYQWMKDGVDLTNQINASLVLSNAAVNTVGYYSCDVTDQNGTTVTSSNAALNISGVNFSFWQGLVAYYPLNGSTNDFSIISNNLINCGGNFTYNRFGQSNGAINLASINYMYSKNNLGITGNSQRTISLWLKVQQNPVWPNGTLIWWGNSNTDTYTGHPYGQGSCLGYLPYYASLSVATLCYGSGYVGADIFANPADFSGTWYNVIVVYKGTPSDTYFYINGQKQSSNMRTNEAVPLNTQDSPLFINQNKENHWYGGQEGVDGIYSDIRIYNRALSSNEVSALFQAEAPVPTNKQTITFPVIPSKAYGSGTITLTATSSAGTNYPITYTSSDPAVATVAGKKVTLTGVGSCLITASQPGDFNYKPATNVSRTLTVTQGNQSISFPAPASRSYSTNTFTLPLNSSAGLPISYDSSSASVATISGNVVTLTGPGSTVITATQDGNANYKAAPTVTRTLVVSQAAQTITFPAIPSKAYGAASFNLGATATSGLPITYTSSNTNVATVSSNAVTIRGVGTATITASQSGNANYVAAPSVGQVLTVTKAAQTISFAALPAKTYGDGTFTLSATASSGLPVTYASANTNVATISGSTVTIRGAGTASITASQAGNTNFNAATAVAKTLTVAKAAQTVAFTPTTPVTYVKSGTLALSASSTASGTGTNVTFASGNTAILSISGKTATMKAKGTVSVTATAAATANYNAASTTNSITLQ